MSPNLFSASLVQPDIRPVGNGGAAAVPVLIAEGVRRRFFRAEDCRYSRGSDCSAGGLFEGGVCACFRRGRALTRRSRGSSRTAVRCGTTVGSVPEAPERFSGRYLKIFIFIASYPAMSYFCMFGGKEQDSTRNDCFGRELRDMHREERTGRPDRGMVIRLY